MTRSLRLYAAIGLCALAVGCGGSPTQPGPQPPTLPPSSPNATTRLTLLVMGNVSQSPVSGLTVEINVPAGAGTPNPNTPTQVTSADGKVSWLVEPNYAYAFTISGARYFGNTVVTSDVQWLLALPR